MTRQIHFTARARRELAEAGKWWLDHRDKAPDAFREDVAETLALIAENPALGAMARNVRRTGV